MHVDTSQPMMFTNDLVMLLAVVLAAGFAASAAGAGNELDRRLSTSLMSVRAAAHALCRGN